MSERDRGEPSPSFADEIDGLERGRACYARRAWADAFQSLWSADQRVPLGGADLERLAMAAYLIGRDDDYLAALDRAHQAHLDSGDGACAIRCAFWLGLRFLFRGEIGQATGWLARAQRLLEREERECVEAGYLLLPAAEQHLDVDDCEAACLTAARAAEIGERFADPDLIACARHLMGRVLIRQGRVDAGLALLDEAMVAVTADDLSPLMTGLIYCSVIDVCQQVYALSRAREWTFALAQWCEVQPEMVAFTGICRVHRAEIMQLHGAWRDAIEEAQRARERAQGVSQLAVAAAFYQQADVHRLRGEFARAERAYRSASQYGSDPQPGLALLRLAQGRTDAAAAAIDLALGAATDCWQRAKLLPAYIEIMLAVGNTEKAREACRDLEDIADRIDAGVAGALTAHACGAVEIAEGDARAALGSLRRAFAGWQRIEAPYPAACARVLAGLACRALGDEEGARLELDAARIVFERLGAVPDLARIDALLGDARSGHGHGLSPRELQVLRLVAAGKTNKSIAADLFLSERTVDRHVSNILTKLDVASRAAATAFAYEHGLI